MFWTDVSTVYPSCESIQSMCSLADGLMSAEIHMYIHTHSHAMYAFYASRLIYAETHMHTHTYSHADLRYVHTHSHSGSGPSSHSMRVGL